MSSENGEDFVIKKDAIHMGNEVIQINEIQEIKVDVNDYLGKVKYRNPRDFTPLQSQGFDNSIKIKTKSERIIEFNFQIKNRSDKFAIEPFIFSLINLDKLSIESGLGALGIKRKKKKGNYTAS